MQSKETVTENVSEVDRLRSIITGVFEYIGATASQRTLAQEYFREAGEETIVIDQK